MTIERLMTSDFIAPSPPTANSAQTTVSHALRHLPVFGDCPRPPPGGPCGLRDGTPPPPSCKTKRNFEFKYARKVATDAPHSAMRHPRCIRATVGRAARPPAAAKQSGNADRRTGVAAPNMPRLQARVRPRASIAAVARGPRMKAMKLSPAAGFGDA